MSARLSALFPPPAELQRRAWECGQDVERYELATSLLRQRLAQLRALPPERLGWPEMAALFALHRLVRVRRHP